MTRSLSALFALAWLASSCGGGGGDPTPDATPPVPRCGDGITLGAGQVQTTAGVVQGIQTGATWRWSGIPFAAAPVGELRLRPPAPPPCRDGVSDATLLAPACPQPDDDGVLVGAEDCLYLNLWAPADATPTSALPVLVFVHGGGHQQGSASQALPDGTLVYDGGRFVDRSAGAIVVTFDYRLGPLGFLAHPALTAEGVGSGNYGMLDQIQALQWVKDNIAAFGGDPARVMVFGESAGAVSTCRLIASPLAAGLFAAAGIESGACVAKTLADAEANGLAVADTVGCDDPATAAGCLRALPYDTLLATVAPLDAALSRQAYDGVVDGHALLDMPIAVITAGAHNRVPVIIGSNTEEQGKAAPLITTQEEYEAAVADYAQGLGLPGLAPALLDHYPADHYASERAALVAMMTDIKFGCPTRKATRALSAAQDEPVYRYVFGKVPDAFGPGAQALGAVHGLELWFVFDVVGDTASAGDTAVIDAMNAGWTNLAAGGDPSGPGLPVTWSAYDVTSDSHLLLDDAIVVESGYRAEQCDWLDSLAN